MKSTVRNLSLLKPRSAIYLYIVIKTDCFEICDPLENESKYPFKDQVVNIRNPKKTIATKEAKPF